MLFNLLSLGSCGSPATETATCSTPTGVAWTPDLSGVSASFRDGSTEVFTETLTATGQVFGYGDPIPTNKEISVSVNMDTDLGEMGSLSLVARRTSGPTALGEEIYPVLVSLHDGTNEWINLARNGSGGDCVETGYFVCSGGSCSKNSNCVTNTPSAFLDRSDWQQHQIPSFGYASVNVFPSCNWSTGTPACAFNSTFFQAGKLRTGTYTARYVLFAPYQSLVNSNFTAQIEVKAIRKKRTAAYTTSGQNGVLDINIILVGDTLIEQSRTDKGKQNLNAVMTHFVDHYNQSATGIRLSKISVYEWGCANDGNTYKAPTLNEIEGLLKTGSGLLESDSEGRAINLFLVEQINISTTSGGTVLGLAGGVGGSPYNGTNGSGVVVSTFAKINEFNPNCPASGACGQEYQEADFIDLGSTISHEVGHYLGLNHPSESDGSRTDPIADTPTCPTTTSGGQTVVNHTSCLTGAACGAACTSYNGTSVFCSTATDCQFNHLMWWTSKRFQVGTTNGDGNLFSTGSSRMILNHPLIQ